MHSDAGLLILKLLLLPILAKYLGKLGSFLAEVRPNRSAEPSVEMTEPFGSAEPRFWLIGRTLGEINCRDFTRAKNCHFNTFRVFER